MTLPTPKIMDARFASRCATCNKSIKPGKQIGHWASSVQTCSDCTDRVQRAGDVGAPAQYAEVRRKLAAALEPTPRSVVAEPPSKHGGRTVAMRVNAYMSGDERALGCGPDEF